MDPCLAANSVATAALLCNCLISDAMANKVAATDDVVLARSLAPSIARSRNSPLRVRAPIHQTLNLVLELFLVKTTPRPHVRI